MQDYKILPLKNRIVKSSNTLISAKFNSNLLENKIMMIARARIEENYTKDSKKPLEASLYPGELIELIGDKAHIYKTLKTVAENITNRSIVIEDGQGNFKSFAMITNADYLDGVFTIKFNDEMRNHILNIEGPYTKTDLLVQSSVDYNSSFRLNDLFTKEIYRSKADVNGGAVQVEYRIAELKAIIGLIDTSSPYVQKEMTACKQKYGVLDWDVIYDKVSTIVINSTDSSGKPKKMYLTKYNSWRDFQKYVLKIAQEEMEKKSTIRFEYEPIREGRKIKKVLFTIYPNKPKIQYGMPVKKDNGQVDIIRSQYEKIFSKFEGHNELTEEDIKLLLEKSGYDEEKVEKAITLADKQNNISNYMGWIIKAIESGYDEVEVAKGSVEQAKIIKDTAKDIKENKEKYAINAWEKIKTKNNFKDFQDFITGRGLDVEMLEIVYTKDECVKAYCDWAVGREVKL